MSRPLWRRWDTGPPGSWRNGWNTVESASISPKLSAWESSPCTWVSFRPTRPIPPTRGSFGAVGEVARYSNERGITLSLETGQETGDQLARFLDRIPEYPVGVNFDFANMVMYRMDDPTDALRRVLDRVTSVHVKDGLPPDSPDALGLETPPGTGKARVKECLEILHKADFQGPLIIENYSWLAGGDTHAAGLYEADAARVWTADPLESLTYAKEYVERCLTGDRSRLIAAHRSTEFISRVLT